MINHLLSVRPYDAGDRRADERYRTTQFLHVLLLSVLSIYIPLAAFDADPIIVESPKQVEKKDQPADPAEDEEAAQ